MKIISQPVFEVTVVLTKDELVGLKKLIGPTSISSRIHEQKLTHTESDALDDVYFQICNILDLDSGE